jgi:hypothetical protein
MIEETKPVRTVKFDERRKELITTVTVDSMKAPNGESSPDFGSNKNVQVLKEPGIKVLIKDLNEQKVNYQRQHKQVEEQLAGLKDVSVNEEFLKNMKAAKEMDQKSQLEDAKKNAEETITAINEQINEVKNAIGKHIKL